MLQYYEVINEIRNQMKNTLTKIENAIVNIMGYTRHTTKYDKENNEYL